MKTEPQALTAVATPPPSPVTTTTDTEAIKARFLELMELAIMGMSEGTSGDTQGMIAAMGPLFLMGMQEVNSQTLQKLLICLSEIVTGVLNLACSQAEYNDHMEPLVRRFIELQGELT